MTPEQKAAFVIAQAACAMAEIAGMQARNARFLGPDKYHAPKEFDAVIEKYGIGQNDVLSLFRS